MTNKKIFPWKIISTKRIYVNPWLKVREDKIIQPTGEKGIYGVIEISPAVGVIPIDDKGKIILLKHWRYPAKKISIEIPLGGINKNETPLAAAKRELFEETGYKAKKWKFLGSFESSNCLTTDLAKVYLAKELYQDNKIEHQERFLEGIKIMKVGLRTVINLVKNNKITESISKGTILLYLYFK